MWGQTVPTSNVTTMRVFLLDSPPLELREGIVEGPWTLLENHAQHLSHDVSEGVLRQLIMERLVRDRHGEQRIELTVNIRQCFCESQRMAREQTQHQPVRGHKAFSVAEPDSVPEVVDQILRQYTLDSVGALGDCAASRSSLRASWWL